MICITFKLHPLENSMHVLPGFVPFLADQDGGDHGGHKMQVWKKKICLLKIPDFLPTQSYKHEIIFYCF